MPPAPTSRPGAVTAPKDRALDVLAARVEVSAGNAAEAERMLHAVIAEDASHLEAYELLGRL